MIHSGLRLLTAVVIANLLAACASTSLIEDQNTLLETDEVIVLTRIKVIYRQCNHCEHRTNPATGKLEIAHPELPAFSIVTAKYPGKLVLSSGGAIKPGPVYLSKPSIEEGEVPIKLGSGGNSVVALRLKKGKTYHLGRYNNEMNVGDTYMFSDQLNIKTPDDLYNYYVNHQVPTEPMLVSLPTDGLYAQTVMDECVGLEEHLQRELTSFAARSHGRAVASG